MQLAVFFLAAAALLSQPHGRPLDPAHKRPAAPAVQRSDSDIQARIQARLATSKIGKNGFRFTTSGGVTTIDGKANVIQHKGAATRLAKTAGARAVVNKIQISEEAKNAAREKLASGRRRVQVKRGDPRTTPR